MTSAEQAAETVGPREIWTEMDDPQTGERYVSGSGLIWHAPDLPRDVIERDITHYHGEGWDHLIVEVQHLTFKPRVKWCSRYDGFGCDTEGEWHGHWFGVKHNPSPLSDCCHVVVLPVWDVSVPRAEQPTAGVYSVRCSHVGDHDERCGQDEIGDWWRPSTPPESRAT